MPPDDDFLLFVAINYVGAFAVFVLWGFPSIFFHELGHTIAAKLLALKPTHLIVGACDAFFTRTVFGVEVVIRLVPFGGLTIAERPVRNKFQGLLFVAAGPVSNVIVMFGAFSLWSHTSFKAILAAIISREAGVIIRNLIPRDIVYEGITLPNDGKLLLQILFGRLEPRLPDA